MQNSCYIKISDANRKDTRAKRYQTHTKRLQVRERERDGYTTDIEKLKRVSVLSQTMGFVTDTAKGLCSPSRGSEILLYRAWTRSHGRAEPCVTIVSGLGLHRGQGWC